jgi:hypothetical protein
MSRTVLAVLGAVVVLSVHPAAAALAAAPSNDDFAAAAVLGVAAPVSGVNVDATVEDAEPKPSAGVIAGVCAAVTDAPFCLPSVWYRFTPETDGIYTIETCDASTELDTVIAVFSGATPGTLSELAANDEGSGSCEGGYGTFGGSRLDLTATAGTPYSVQVTGYDGEQGSFWLRAYRKGDPPAPATVDTRMKHWTSVAYATAKDNLGWAIFSGARRTPSFGFESPTDGATFECSLDGAAYAACSSPLSLDGVAGAHVLRARGIVAGAADATPVVIPFSIDRAAPDTSITGSEGALDVTNAAWSAASTEPFYEERFRCGLDAVPTLVLCGADFPASSLCQGAHTFRSAAIDRAGNVDPTPASRTVTVTTGAACGAPEMPAGGIFANVFGSATTQDVQATFDNHGAGTRFHVEYGTTTAYGERSKPRLWPPQDSEALYTQTLEGLEPSTLYHFRVVASSPFGTVASDDVTFTTQAAVSELPVLGIGGVTVAGQHAARIAVDLDTKGASLGLRLYIETGAGEPVSLASPIVRVNDARASAASGPRTIELTDLEPGMTYRYRVLATDNASNTVLSEERSFTTPAVPVDDPDPIPPGPPPPPNPPVEPPAFVLSKSNVVARSPSRRARFLRLVVSGLPPSAAVRVSARARGKGLGSTRGTAATDGVSRLAIKLSRKARKLLRNPQLERITLRVAVTPPGQVRSSIKRTVRLKRNSGGV